jgi:hypothetical protein
MAASPLLLPHSDKSCFEIDIFFYSAPKGKTSFLKGARRSFSQNPFPISVVTPFKDHGLVKSEFRIFAVYSCPAVSC